MWKTLCEYTHFYFHSFQGHFIYFQKYAYFDAITMSLNVTLNSKIGKLSQHANADVLCWLKIRSLPKLI